MFLPLASPAPPSRRASVVSGGGAELPRSKSHNDVARVLWGNGGVYPGFVLYGGVWIWIWIWWLLRGLLLLPLPLLPPLLPLLQPQSPLPLPPPPSPPPPPPPHLTPTNTQQPNSPPPLVNPARLYRSPSPWQATAGSSPRVTTVLCHVSNAASNRSLDPDLGLGLCLWLRLGLRLQLQEWIQDYQQERKHPEPIQQQQQQRAHVLWTSPMLPSLNLDAEALPCRHSLFRCFRLCRFSDVRRQPRLVHLLGLRCLLAPLPLLAPSDPLPAQGLVAALPSRKEPERHSVTVVALPLAQIQVLDSPPLSQSPDDPHAPALRHAPHRLHRRQPRSALHSR